MVSSQQLGNCAALTLVGTEMGLSLSMVRISTNVSPLSLSLDGLRDMQPFAVASSAGAAVLAGETKPYDYLPYFYSREFALSWQFYGVTAGADQVVHWGDMSPTAATAAAACAATPKFGAYWLRDGRVVGAFMEGANGEESAALKSLGSSRPKAPPVEELVEQGVAFAMQCKL